LFAWCFLRSAAVPLDVRRGSATPVVVLQSCGYVAASR
jgi:hypothetical protein